ncbi:MAG: hypothetical protein EA366_01670 [Spirulina sp. DLM2.Bin59]|nr:MAG: hypothetical protein EA366_01670 [Spirulina sp. DLM2.Bin59]
MSQRDGFGSGFLLGALIGGTVGGIVGALAAGRRSPLNSSEEFAGQEPTEESIEGARRSLESKIAQLNLAIDDVREQLGSVNGSSPEP